MLPILSGFLAFEIIFTVFFCLAAVVVLFGIVRTVIGWHKNNRSPRLTVEAAVAAKRTDVTHTQNANAGDITGAHGFTATTHTTFYVTFEVESGDRMEFAVRGEDFGQLAEGDRGRLSFQGTRYLGFAREKQ